MTIKHSGDQHFQEDVQKGLVLVDFWANWCGPCKMIAPVLEELSEELGEEVKILKIDVDTENKTTAQYGVMSIPTLLLFKDGTVVGKTAGYKTREDLLEFIEKHK